MRTWAAVACGLALVAAGCSGGPARLSEYGPGSGGGLGVHETLSGRPYAFDDMTLCLDEPGSVVVTGVEPIDPTGGFEVAGFSVQPAREADTINHLTHHTQRLAAAGFPADGPMVVDSVCPSVDDDQGRLYLLGIEVSRTDPDAGGASGFLVTYESGGRSLTVVQPFGLTLCAAPPGQPPPECEVRIVEPG